MTTTNPATQAWLDQDHRRIADIIRKHGVAITYVGDDADCAACRAGLPAGEAGGPHEGGGTSFAYTIGLFGMGHPELLVFGLDARDSMALLNDVAGRVRAGGEVVAGELLTFSRWKRRALAEIVPNPGEIAFGANRFYQRPAGYSVKLLQLSYDDAHGVFPGEPGCSGPASRQPRPGTFRA